jgi:hypothetical protein
MVPDDLAASIKAYFGSALDIEVEAATTATLKAFLENGRVLYPSRITRYGLKIQPRAPRWDRNTVFFMDGTSAFDLVDYWNLRAAGRAVIQCLSNSLAIKIFALSW